MTATIILLAINLAVVSAIFFRLRKKSTPPPMYTEKDITAFGNYLLSDERKNSVYSNQDKEVAAEIYKGVSDADYRNWQDAYIN